MESLNNFKTFSAWDKFKCVFLAPLGGFLLLGSAFVLLDTGERDFVDQMHKSDFIIKNAVEIDANVIDGANEGKLVHVVGTTSAGEKLSDSIMSIPNAIHLKRKVEMYQWVEDKTQRVEKISKQLDKTVYKYFRQWSSDVIDSSKFQQSKKFVNPQKKPLEDEIVTAKNAKLGAFTLGRKLAKTLPDWPVTPVSAPKGYTIEDSIYFYKGANYAAPEIGDIRISYIAAIAPDEVSILARQNGNKLSVYKAEDSMKIIDVLRGQKTIAQIVDERLSESFENLWILRGVSLVLIWIGLILMLQPIFVITHILTFFKNLSEPMAAWLTLPIAAAITLTTGALVFIIHRPQPVAFVFLAIGALLLLGAFYYAWRKIKKLNA